MSSDPNYDSLLQSVRDNYAAGQLAHAYVITGSPRAAGKRLATDLALMVVCESHTSCGTCAGCRRVQDRVHPDIYWLEPQSKSRWILVDDMNTLLHNLSQKSFEGGWKVAILLYADRVNEASANKFLKTLEEPSPNTLLLLVTDQPSALLATIRSRCQLLALSGEAAGEAEVWEEPVLDVLRRGRPSSVMEGLVAAAYIHAIMSALPDEEGEVEEEDDADKKVRDARDTARQKETRARILTFIMHWYRDLLLAVLDVPADTFYFPKEAERLREQAAGLSYRQVSRRLQSLEKLSQRLEQNLPPLQVFEQFFVDFAR